METVESIGEAIELIDAKKAGLQKAYDDLQSNFPSVLPSLSLTWPDLDSHFSSLQDSLTQQLNVLVSLVSGPKHLKDGCGSPGIGLAEASNQPSEERADPTRPELDADAPDDPLGSTKPPSPERVDSVPARLGSESSPNTEAEVEPPSSSHQEQNLASGTDLPTSTEPVSQVLVDADPPALPRSSDTAKPGAVENSLKVKALCLNVDGKGLITYILGIGNDRPAIRALLSVELHNCPDPGKLILDAMGGFYRTKAAKEDEALPKPRWIKTVRIGCIFLLEVMMRANPQLNERAKRRAKGLALMWKKRLKKDTTNQSQVLGFLLLVAAFGLASEFGFEDLVEYFVFVASSSLAPELCQGLGLGDGIPDVIQKLISDRKELLAVRFIFDLGMTEKFPPVPILKSYLNEISRLTGKACDDGKNSPQVQREAIDKEIEAVESVIKIIEDHKLEAEYPKEELHRRVQQLDQLKADKKRAAKAQEPKNPQLSGNKRPRPNPADSSRRIAGFDPHLGSAPAPYHFMHPDSAGASSSYQVPSAEFHGFAGVGPPRPYLYPPELQQSPVYGNIPFHPAYGGYSLPPRYHPPYYPH